MFPTKSAFTTSMWLNSDLQGFQALLFFSELFNARSDTLSFQVISFCKVIGGMQLINGIGVGGQQDKVLGFSLMHLQK